MDLAVLFAHTAPFAAEYIGHTFAMQIFTEKLTPQYKAELMALTSAEGEERKDENAQMLADLVASWDKTLNGEEFPPTYENLMQLSYPCLASLLRQISTFLGDLANPQSAQS